VHAVSDETSKWIITPEKAIECREHGSGMAHWEHLVSSAIEQHKSKKAIHLGPVNVLVHTHRREGERIVVSNKGAVSKEVMVSTQYY